MVFHEKLLLFRDYIHPGLTSGRRMEAIGVNTFALGEPGRHDTSETSGTTPKRRGSARGAVNFF